jgi:hypothetical protein
MMTRWPSLSPGGGHIRADGGQDPGRNSRESIDGQATLRQLQERKPGLPLSPPSAPHRERPRVLYLVISGAGGHGSLSSAQKADADSTGRAAGERIVV